MPDDVHHLRLLSSVRPDEDSQALGVDSDRLVYTTVADLPDAPDKSRRDAGGLSVVDLFPPDP